MGQNVLAPQKQLDVPQQLGTLEFASSTEGAEALAQISRLHGTDIKLTNAYIAEYVNGNQRVTIWVGHTESKSAGAELTKQMLQAIDRGSSVFSNLQRLTIADREVFQVDGPGGKHFFYNSTEEVVWLTIEATDPLPLLEQAVNTF